MLNEGEDKVGPKSMELDAFLTNFKNNDGNFQAEFESLPLKDVNNMNNEDLFQKIVLKKKDEEKIIRQEIGNIIEANQEI